MRRNVLIVSYGSREAAMADALSRSSEPFSLYFADKQANPFNINLAQKTGGKHAVIPQLEVEKIYQLASEIPNLQFVLPGPEGPIIQGVADRIEDGLGIPVLAPRQKYAIEKDKAEQRRLIGEVAPEANPEYRVFIREGFLDLEDALDAADRYMERFGYNVVLKPLSPAAGKGVVVFGDHFQTPEQAKALFSERYEGGVIIEEKLEGEESSFMAFCDGNRIFPVPYTRDYKRASDKDRGPNTGGMGSYMDKRGLLPFMEEADREGVEQAIQRIFEAWRGDRPNPGLKGMPFYVAIMHTRDGYKILEINSRPGDPEFMNVIPAMETDFGQLCLQMINGSVEGIRMKPLDSVVTYLVPPPYGGKNPGWKGDRRVGLSRAYELMLDSDDMIRVYPGSLELADREMRMLSSRTVACVGLSGENIGEARRRSLEAADAVKGDFWRRTDIASPFHISKSISHMRSLRGKS